MSFPKKIAFHWQVLIALMLAALIGGLVNEQTQIAGIYLIDILTFFGTLFLNALKMIVVPLVVASIIVGVASIADDHAFGRLGAKTLGYYLITSTLSIAVGLLLVNLLMPGSVDDDARHRILATLPDTSSVMDKVGDKTAGDIAGVLLRMVPPNIFHAAAEGQLLGLIFFSVVFGFFMVKVTDSVSQPMVNFWAGVQEVMIQITLWIIRFMPYGVFALVTKTVIISGMDAVLPLLKFFLTVLAALALHFFVTLPLLLRMLAVVKPFQYMGQVSPALLTAFSTASSSATLPVSLNSVQQRAGVSKRVSSFVLPLGATINMDGTALYECVVVIFIAQLYGFDLSFATQLTIVTLALLTSIGVAGVPAASLVAITLILSAVGLPIEAIGLILAVDRILDMCRTGVNVFGDLSGACVIARSEKETLHAGLEKS